MEDPVVSSSRREAIIAIALWLVAMIYTVGYCYAYGYQRPPEDLRFILGVPDWVFWGIFAPWIVWTIVSALFAQFVMQDAYLGEDETVDEAATELPVTPVMEASHG
jgi:uncharacterized membrane protein YhdT